MTEDYLKTEAREKAIRDAQIMKLHRALWWGNKWPTALDAQFDSRNYPSNDAINLITSWLADIDRWYGKSWDEMLERVKWIVWVNWTPTWYSKTPSYYSKTPTTNYWWNNLVWNNGKVVYNPANFNWQEYKPFSVADTLAQRAQWYQAQGLEWLANSFKTLNKENNAYNNTANKITDYYTALANDINSRENALAQRKESLANQLSQDIANNRQYVMDYFWPNWIFTNEVNKFYDENGNYLASEAGRQMAMANAEWIQSGASLWAQRAARNEAYNNAFQNYLKVKEQEIAAKTSIAQQLINYMTALRQEYWETQNAYVISQYQRANDLLNTISQNLAQTQASIASAKMQQSVSSSTRNSLSDPYGLKFWDNLIANIENWTATPMQQKIFLDQWWVIKPVEQDENWNITRYKADTTYFRYPTYSTSSTKEEDEEK